MKNLTPQLVNAGTIKMTYPENRAAEENFENLRKQYAAGVQSIRYRVTVSRWGPEYQIRVTVPLGSRVSGTGNSKPLGSRVSGTGNSKPPGPRISGTGNSKPLERLQPMPKSQLSLVRSQHPPTQWNLRAADEAVLNKVHQKSNIKKSDRTQYAAGAQSIRYG